MPELETLYVRIETDLTAFKRGMAEARRETQDFAKEARGTFSGVGDSLDLRQFRNQLAVTETAAKQTAERMRKAFAEVGKAQESAARETLKKFSELSIAPSLILRQGNGRGFTESREGHGDEERIGRTVVGALAGAPLLTPLLLLPMINATVLTILGLMTLGAGIGATAANLDVLVGGNLDENRSLDEQIEKLNTTIQGLLSQEGRAPQQARPGMGMTRDERLEAARKELRALEAMRDASEEQQRQARETATQFQDFLGAFTELSTCLRELCARIDELAPLSSGGAEAPQPGGIGFEGAGAGARLVPASFTGASPFAGAGLVRFNEELEATGWHAGDAAARIAELTMSAGGYRAEAGALLRVLRAGNAAFDDQVGVVRLLDALLPELGEAMTGVFTESSAAGRELDRVAEALGGTLVDAFRGAALEGESFREVLLKIIQDILVLSQTSLGGAGGGGSFLGGLFDSLLGGLFGGASASAAPAFAVPTLAIAKGNVFLRGRTLPEALAQGGVLHNGVVNRPTLFAMAKGYGLMGEAGPEAVMPLTRLPNGELGVKGLPGGTAPAVPGPVHITINAPGADRGAIQELTREIRRQGEYLRRLDSSIEARAIGAVNWRRSRSPW